MLRKQIKKRLKAFSLVEVLFAVVLLGAAISTILVSLSGQLSHVSSSNKDLQASSIASEGIDAARAIRDANWANLSDGVHGLTYANGGWSFTGASDVQNGFTRTVTVSDVTTNQRKVTVSVAWKGTAGEPRTYGFSTVLANWRNLDTAPAGGTLVGDWHDPVFVGNMLDFGTGFRGLSAQLEVNFLYIAGFGTISAANELVVVDVTNPLVPFFRGSINTGTGFNKLYVDTTRHLVFAANASKGNQLQVIDVSNPDSLKLKKQYGISGNTQTGRSIYGVGNTVYLGTEGPATNEFYVLDVTNATSPVVKGQLSVGNDINAIEVVGNYAYIGSDVDGREAGIINVTNPENPTVSSWIDTPGANHTECVYYDETDQRLYIGRQLSTDTGTPEIVILDVSNPTNPRIIGQMEYDFDINTIYAEGNLMFITADGKFKAYNVSSLPAITFYGEIDFGVGDVPTDIVYNNNVFYITIFQRYALRIISAY